MFVHEHVVYQMLASGYLAQVLADGEPETDKTNDLAYIWAAIYSNDLTEVIFTPPIGSGKNCETMWVAIDGNTTPAESIADFTCDGEIEKHWNAWQEEFA